MSEREMITEPSRQIPVFRKCDVLVVGGGPAGTAAASTAGRMGADTIVVERYGHLGGMSTGGFVHFIEKMTDWEGRRVMAGFADDILDRMPREDVLGPPDELWGSKDPKLVEYWGDRQNAYHGIITWSPTVDPEMLKIVSSDILRDHGVKQLLHSWAVAPIQEGNTVKGVIFESKSGRQAILADVVIDASGDGDIFAMAGAPFEGDVEPGSLHSKMNTSFMLGGVDMERYLDFRRENAEEYQQIMQLGVDNGLAPDTWPTAMPRNDIALFMGGTGKFSEFSHIDVEGLSEVEIISRGRIVELMEHYKQNMPGFDGAWLMNTSSQIGTRHSRRLVGVKKILREEWTQGKVHEDEIGITPAPSPRNPNVSIPLGCLLPAKLDGLMAAGRNLSCDEATHTFLRLIPQCWVMGQAAAVAAATAINAGVAVRDVNVADVRSELAKQGVVLHRQAGMPEGLVPRV